MQIFTNILSNWNKQVRFVCLYVYLFFQQFLNLGNSGFNFSLFLVSKLIFTKSIISKFTIQKTQKRIMYFKVASMYFWSVSLVYQLFGQFLIFLVDQKKIWLTKKNFGIPKRNLIDQKNNLVNQKNIWYNKKNLVYQKPKKNKKLTGKLVYQRD